MNEKTKNMSLSDVITESVRFGSQVYMATVSPSGMPYVTPVVVAWKDDMLWAAVGLAQAKVKNLEKNNQISCHWNTGESLNYDGLMVWGTAQIFDDLETKRRMWEGVFDYDLTAINGGGPDEAAHACLIAITPSRALLLRKFGVEGREVWRAG
jgi:nitroimidazol reductase NimA-like FMN-containing flavoprotein (pyridoxamine 5'-phosphate oxidase superfamily)